jgi:nicotinamide-nucleotide amidase
MSVDKSIPPLDDFSLDDKAWAVAVVSLACHLVEQGWRLATAESCTGGWLAKILTDLPGSSAWFECGYVTYSNAAKQRLLGVPEALITAQGAVSEAVAIAMAQGAQRDSGAEFAVGITGIAGPEGGTPQKPVGTVCIAWIGFNRVARVQTYRFPGDRDEVRRQSVSTALQGLLALVQIQAQDLNDASG